MRNTVQENTYCCKFKDLIAFHNWVKAFEMIPWGMHQDLEQHIMYATSGFIHQRVENMNSLFLRMSKDELPPPDATFVDLPDPVYNWRKTSCSYFFHFDPFWL